MPVGLTCSHIAMLYDIGEFDLLNASGQQKSDLECLLAERYVEPAADDPKSRFQLSELGLAFLRGEMPLAAE